MHIRKEAVGQVPAKREGFRHADGGKHEEYMFGEEGWHRVDLKEEEELGRKEARQRRKEELKGV